MQQNIDDEITSTIDLCRGAGIDNAGRIRLLDDGWPFYEDASVDQCPIVDS